MSLEPTAWVMQNADHPTFECSLHWQPQEHWHITWEAKPLYALTPEQVAMLEGAKQSPEPERNGGKTGYPPGLLQDDSRKLTDWMASKPDARLNAREAAAAIERERAQQEQPEPTPAAQPEAPLFASGVARRKWQELQARGYRMQSITFESPDRSGRINAWGAVEWTPAPAAQPSPPADAQAEAQGEREALSDEEIRSVWDKHTRATNPFADDGLSFARAILAANERKTK